MKKFLFQQEFSRIEVLGFALAVTLSLNGHTALGICLFVVVGVVAIVVQSGFKD